jgi:ribosomal protein L35AE/L33A
MKENLFYVERTILLSTKKKFVIVGITLQGNLNSGMQAINEIKGVNQIIESIEFVDTKEESYLGLVICYKNNDELQKLHLLEKGDILSCHILK